jgi:hypothetical protein
MIQKAKRSSFLAGNPSIALEFHNRTKKLTARLSSRNIPANLPIFFEMARWAKSDIIGIEYVTFFLFPKIGTDEVSVC